MQLWGVPFEIPDLQMNETDVLRRYPNLKINEPKKTQKLTGDNWNIS